MTTHFEIVGHSPRGDYVRGWASVATRDDAPVTDYEGDQIGIETLRRAAHDYVTGPRTVLVEHAGHEIGKTVESMIVDEDIAKALGVSNPRRGWMVGMRITDPGTQEKVRKGVLKGFSIGGRGRRVALQKSACPENAGVWLWRPVLNTVDLMAWAMTQGFTSITPPREMRVTIIRSPTHVDTWAAGRGPLYLQEIDAPRAIETVNGVVCLAFPSEALSRQQRLLIAQGATPDVPTFTFHIPLTRNASGINLAAVTPFEGTLILGPEREENFKE